MNPVIDYYFCLLSPWAYLGDARFRAIATKHHAIVAYRPVKIREVLAATGGLPLKQRSAQRKAYRMMDLRRWKAYRNMPMILEPRHEFPETDFHAARTVIAARQLGLDIAELSFAYLRAMWLEERDIADKPTIDAILRANVPDPGAVLARSRSAEVEAEFDANTRDAIAANVFGVPAWVIANGELFWGQDRLELLDLALGRPA